MTRSSSHDIPSKLQLVKGVFEDIDALAAGALEWDQEYEQIGRVDLKGG